MTVNTKYPLVTKATFFPCEGVIVGRSFGPKFWNGIIDWYSCCRDTICHKCKKKSSNFINGSQVDKWWQVLKHNQSTHHNERDEADSRRSQDSNKNVFLINLFFLFLIKVPDETDTSYEKSMTLTCMSMNLELFLLLILLYYNYV